MRCPTTASRQASATITFFIPGDVKLTTQNHVFSLKRNPQTEHSDQRDQIRLQTSRKRQGHRFEVSCQQD
jgi:hypothetical protein